jgi:glyoxylase-like metal-dependent hydrolase (beta-lactamase superfamily II)
MVRPIATLLLALATSACGIAPVSAAARPAIAPAAQATQAGTLHRFTSDAAGFATNSHYLDTGREVIVFDAQFTPAHAQQLVADIRLHTRSPITHVVVSHPNPDKFNGASVFQQLVAKVVASEETARAIPGVHAYKKYYFVNLTHMFTEATYPAQARIDVTFRDRLTLANGAVELRKLRHAGVSSTQTVAYLPGLKALVVGDLVHHQAHAWLEGGIVDGAPRPDLKQWKAALEELKAYPGAIVHGGRGESAPVAVAVKAQGRYLDRLEALTRSYVAGLGDREGELDGPQAAKHHQALTQRAQEAFPGYALPFMVEYSIYGLVQAVRR